MDELSQFVWSAKYGCVTPRASTLDFQYGRGVTPREALLELAGTFERIAAFARAAAESESCRQATRLDLPACIEDANAIIAPDDIPPLEDRVKNFLDGEK